jgi:hypothetical protein
LEKTTNLPPVTDKLYHIMLSTVLFSMHFVHFQLGAVMVHDCMVVVFTTTYAISAWH